LHDDLNHLSRKERIVFNMKAEHTIDKSARAGRATQIAAMVITGLVTVIWVYFGRLYLIHDPDEWRIANQQLGYPFTQADAIVAFAETHSSKVRGHIFAGTARCRPGWRAT
jgi:hypothetical protein